MAAPLAVETGPGQEGEAREHRQARRDIGHVQHEDPPEQVQEQQLTHMTDIFSLGVVLHELAAGEAPFSAASVALNQSSLTNAETTPIPVSIRNVMRRSRSARSSLPRLKAWRNSAAKNASTANASFHALTIERSSSFAACRACCLAFARSRAFSRRSSAW